MRGGLRTVSWCECYDDRGHDFVCGFQMNQERASGMELENPQLNRPGRPIKLVWTDSTAETRKTWMRKVSW